MLRFPFLRKVKLKKDLEPQEVFLDHLAKKKEQELGISEKKLEVPLSAKMLKLVLILFLIIIFGLFIKTFHFQIFEGDKFSALAEKNKFAYLTVKAERGVIYDSRGKQIVFNQPSFDLVLNKEKLPRKEKERIRVLEEVGSIINQDYHQFENKTLILKNLDYQMLISLKTRIADLPGFEIKYNSVRYYPDGPTFAPLIGYTGREASDYVGKDGLERYYEEVLRKNPGKIQVERDALGNILSEKTVSLPESGHSLVLWVDAELQKKVEEELNAALQKTGSKKAVGVALNPKNGGVLALVSLPNYDNNLFNKEADQKALQELLTNPEEPLFNRVISGLYPTGSTIKPLVAAAVLQEQLISPDKKINCQGFISIPHPYDPKKETRKNDWTVHGWTDMRKAIAESCNVYFYTVGGGYRNQEGLGPTRIKKYLELFGWGQKTGIDLPGESKGFIPSPEWKREVKKENWWDGDTYNFSIGQGDISITPIQVAASFVAIANGGTLYKPKVVKQIVDSEKKLIEEFNPEVLRENFINKENLQIVREGMRRAVTGEGSPHTSSVLLNSLPVEAAAKTGTAELGGDFYNSWITVFAPYDNPEIVLTIMIERVKGIRSTALIVAKEVLEWYFSRRNN